MWVQPDPLTLQQQRGLAVPNSPSLRTGHPGSMQGAAFLVGHPAWLQGAHWGAALQMMPLLGLVASSLPAVVMSITPLKRLKAASVLSCDSLRAEGEGGSRRFCVLSHSVSHLGPQPCSPYLQSPLTCRHLKLNTIPESLAFANHKGDLLVGLEQHLYLIPHTKYLPSYYQMQVGPDGTPGAPSQTDLHRCLDPPEGEVLWSCLAGSPPPPPPLAAAVGKVPGAPQGRFPAHQPVQL